MILLEYPASYMGKWPQNQLITSREAQKSVCRVEQKCSGNQYARGCEVGGTTKGFTLVKLISNSKLDLSPELQTVSCLSFLFKFNICKSSSFF